MALKVIRPAPQARLLAGRLLGHVELLQVDVGVGVPEWQPFKRAVCHCLRDHDLLCPIGGFPQICLTFLGLMLRALALLRRLLRVGRILPVPISLDPVEPPVHVVVLEVRARLRALVLLARVIVEIDALVVDEIDSTVILLLIVFAASFCRGRGGRLLLVRAVLEFAVVLHDGISIMSYCLGVVARKEMIVYV